MVVILELAFYGVFVTTLVAYLRSRRPLERDVAAVFGSLAAVLALQFLRGHLPGGPTTITDLGVALLVSQPYLILRVVSHSRPLSRLVRNGSLGLLVATVTLFCVGIFRLLVVYLPGHHVWAAYLGLGFLFCLGGAILYSKRGSPVPAGD